MALTLKQSNGSSASYVTHYQGPRDQTMRTPQEFFDDLHRLWHFTMDGAASAYNTLLPRYSSEAEHLAWLGERVFCNPPWSNIRQFVELAPSADAAVLLVPARVNAKWFHRALQLGARVNFFQGKLNFGGAHNSPVDCLLLIFERNP